MSKCKDCSNILLNLISYQYFEYIFKKDTNISEILNKRAMLNENKDNQVLEISTDSILISYLC